MNFLNNCDDNNSNSWIWIIAIIIIVLIFCDGNILGSRDCCNRCDDRRDRFDDDCQGRRDDDCR